MEVAPVLIALPVLWATQRRFPLTSLLYLLIFMHALVLMVGGAYSYARVPLGFQLPQSDMFLALLGSSAALMGFSALHDSQIRRLAPPRP